MIGLPEVAEFGVGIGYELQTVGSALYVGGDVQGLSVVAVLHGMIEIDEGTQIVVVPVFALYLLALGIGAVEVIATVQVSVVCNADIGPCCQLVLHDDVGLGQCLAGAVEHLLELP